MYAIKHRLSIRSTPTEIFRAISQPEGLNAWWTKYCKGHPVVGSAFVFGFTGGFEWTADVTAVDPQRMIEWRFTDAEPDWTGTRLCMELTTEGQDTWVSFLHDGWAADNAHFCHSSFCWAQYLRLLRRWVEDGTTLPYEERSRA